MSILEQFNALIWSWSEMLRALRRRVALLPLLIYAAAQVAILAAIVWFAYPPMNAFVAPLLRAGFGESALHYPTNFYVLRAAFGRADMPLWVFLGALTTGSAVFLFGSFYRGSRERFGVAWREAGRRYLPVVAVLAIILALSQILTRVPTGVFGHLADQSPMRFRLVRLVAMLAVVIVQAVLVYAIPSIVVAGRRLGRSLRESVVLALRHPITTFFIVAVPTVLELLPVWMVRQTRTIMYRFSPEFMIVVMLIWVAVAFVSTYAIAGAATRFFLHATQSEGPESDQGREER